MWNLIDILNSYITILLYGKKIEFSITRVLNDYNSGNIKYRVLCKGDIWLLIDMITRQYEGFDKYFKPHDFGAKTLGRLCKNSSFLMLGAFDEDKLVGYFFIRFFANGKAFRGKMVDVDYRGKGIAKQMGIIMTEIALGAGFSLFATISKANFASIASSEAVNKITVIKELPDDYIYVQYNRK